MKGIPFATEYKQANNTHRARQKDLASDDQKAHAFRTAQCYLSFSANPHKRIDMPLSYLVSPHQEPPSVSLLLRHLT